MGRLVKIHGGKGARLWPYAFQQLPGHSPHCLVHVNGGKFTQPKELLIVNISDNEGGREGEGDTLGGGSLILLKCHQRRKP